MDNLGDIRSAVQSDLTIGSESTLFPPATVDVAINRAYRKIGGLYRWSKTEDAKTTSTEANQNYYDYPENWRPDTIWKLEIDDKDYDDPLSFKDFLYETRNNIPSGKERIWANQWTRFFVYPTPTTTGSNNISVWGQKVVDELVNDSDETIFTDSLPEVNDAIVKEAVAILKAKGQEQNSGTMLSAEAVSIVAGAWNQIKQNVAKEEQTQGGWDVPDFFGKNSKTKIGDFN